MEIYAEKPAGQVFPGTIRAWWGHRVNERKLNEDVKRIAYIVDFLTIQILDMVSGLTVATLLMIQMSIGSDSPEKSRWLSV